MRSDTLDGGEGAHPRLLNLDGLRGLGAIAILLYHAGFVLKVPFVTHGHIAVDFFFLLSGFVLAFTYQAKLSAGDALAFLRARLVRLWPLMAIGCCYGLVADLAMHQTTSVYRLLIKFALSLLCLPLISGVPFPLNAPQWSLLFEGVANVCHAAFFRRLHRPLLVVIVLAGAAGMVFEVAHHVDLNGGYGGAGMLMPVLRLVFGYCLGLLIYTLPKPLLRLPFWAPASVFAALTLFPTLAGASLVDLAAVLLVWPLVLVGSIRDPTHSAISVSALKMMGALSYPLYILHYPTLRLVDHFGAGLPSVVLIPLGVTLSLAAGGLGMIVDPAARSVFGSALAAMTPRWPLAGRPASPPG